MAAVKLVLDDALDYDFEIIAIHCSFEDYKMAYYLNAFLGLKLQRQKKDIDFETGDFFALYSRFVYHNVKDYVTYTLLSNKCKARQVQHLSSGGLFNYDTDDHYKTLTLIPELKRADYLLKIESDQYNFVQKPLLLSLNQIPQLVTAYQVPITTLKSKKNLIFE